MVPEPKDSPHLAPPAERRALVACSWCGAAAGQVHREGCLTLTGGDREVAIPPSAMPSRDQVETELLEARRLLGLAREALEAIGRGEPIDTKIPLQQLLHARQLARRALAELEP